MVLKVTATSPAPSSAGEQRDAKLHDRRSRRRGAAPTRRRPARARRRAAWRARRRCLRREVTTNASGSGLRPSAPITSARPCTAAHVLERLLARDEAHRGDARVGAQPLAERLRVGAARLRREEERDARLEGEPHAGGAAGSRAARSRRRAARARCRSPAHSASSSLRLAARAPERLPVLAQPGRSRDASAVEDAQHPLAVARDQRLVVGGDEHRDADLVEGDEDLEDRAADSASRLAVGSSATRSAGRFTTARAMRDALLLAARELDRALPSRARAGPPCRARLARGAPLPSARMPARTRAAAPRCRSTLRS